MNHIRSLLVPTLSGAFFAAGLVLSGMTRPGKVVAFLDVAGAWDPSLAFVMVGAIAVQAVAWWLSRRMSAPWAADAFVLPTFRDVDARLLGGAVLFGVGWGLGGFCPGPVLVSLATGSTNVLVFVAAMFAGMKLFQLVDRAPAETDDGAARETV